MLLHMHVYFVSQRSFIFRSKKRRTRNINERGKVKRNIDEGPVVAAVAAAVTQKIAVKVAITNQT